VSSQAPTKVSVKEDNLNLGLFYWGPACQTPPSFHSLTIVLSAGAVTAEAAPLMVGDYINVLSGPGTTAVTNLRPSSTTTSFISFCLQQTEYINFVNDFSVARIIWKRRVARSHGAAARAPVGKTHIGLEKLLIVRLGSLGDIVHAVPAAAAIRRVFPQAKVDWLVDVRHRDILELVPVVDRRIWVDTGSARSLRSAVSDLRRARYDVALDLQGLLKSAVLARLSGAARVIGFPSELLRERSARFFYTETAGDMTPHVIDKNLSMLKAVGIRMPEIEFPLEDRNPAIASDARVRLDIPEGAPFAIINPGAAWPNKRWPPVYFAEVAQGLAKRHGLRSLVLWGPGEEQLAENVATAANGVAAVSPKTGVADLVSLLKAASLMISGDTGPLHIAAAAGTPIIGIFGPTDPQRNGPWVEDDLVVSRYGACVCHYQRQCRISGWCLLDISPREVLDLADRRIRA
jgi:lipopolysaccharide heptosyltransferase I